MSATAAETLLGLAHWENDTRARIAPSTQGANAELSRLLPHAFSSDDNDAKYASVNAPFIETGSKLRFREIFHHCLFCSAVFHSGNMLIHFFILI
jgi:hypothetical protein